ncbi:MAG: 1-acyl-sn-glycerol-3-phosphate acyltransferase [Candidatus Marinimicrobia bacterium]|nr:1-acyl-sn-glycerol-3-phosphate acyltransferase [Candidatus Neomarinimicrobiota bacterium]
MNDGVTLPLWLVLLGGLLASWALLARLLIPSVRWFFRRRLNIVIDEVNQRLDLQIPAFKLTRRRILIDQLTYDPQVLEAVEQYCREHQVPSQVALEKVGRYAREIVPAFNAFLYFSFGSWLARSVVRLLYRVRMGYTDEEGLSRVEPNSSVVFVMNHRSNMDYIMLAYMALNKAALSYAVGEWARVWPVQQLVRALGGYFVRRNSGNVLYRRVLARYVQMATEGGVVQAIFPEGRLSRDGNLHKPKIGLLDYMLRSFDPGGRRDLVFIPVAVNYDRVLEDRTLLLESDPKGNRPPKWRAIKTTIRFIIHNLRLMLRGGWYRFGYAAVNFGTPISMREYVREQGVDFRSLERAERIERVQQFAARLMDDIGRIIPLLPVSLVASIFSREPDSVLSHLDLKTRFHRLVEQLKAQGAQVYLPRDDRGYAFQVGLRMLTLRHLVSEEDSLYRLAPGEQEIVSYYAQAVNHLLEPLKEG